jgi:hypothetical protein
LPSRDSYHHDDDNLDTLAVFTDSGATFAMLADKFGVSWMVNCGEA